MTSTNWALCFALLLATAAAAAPDAAAVKSMFAAANFTGNVRVHTAPPSAKPAKVELAFGSLDARGFVPMPTDAHFQMASNTKLVTAIAMYQLQERGLVNVSHNIADYLTAADLALMGAPGMKAYCPKVPGSDACQAITFVQLMSMSSGLEELGIDTRPYPGSTPQVMARYIKRPLIFVPGEEYNYSNVNFMFLGFFIEKFANVGLQQYFREHVFAPLGMADAVYDPFGQQFGMDVRQVEERREFLLAGNRSRRLATGLCTVDINMGSVNGAGGVVASQADDARLYYGTFNFSYFTNPKVTVFAHKLFANASSLLALVHPFTRMGPQSQSFFAQGIVVQAMRRVPHSGAVIPSVLLYTGGTLCTETSNIMEVISDPPLMTQVWSNAPVLFVPSLKALEAARAMPEGTYLEVEGYLGWATPKTATALNNELYARFA
jgi:CubicO group peptidase (beta-lactamase class C family)